LQLFHVLSWILVLKSDVTFSLVVKYCSRKAHMFHETGFNIFSAPMECAIISGLNILVVSSFSIVCSLHDMHTRKVNMSVCRSGGILRLENR
jgi:hypothetical protein